MPVVALKGDTIAGQGNRESDWRASAALSGLPRADLATLLGQARRLVIVAPHPDDEILGCGGLIKAAVDAGLPVLLICLTDGEAAYPDHPAWPAATLATLRREELVSAALVLGVAADQVLHLGFPDGQLSAQRDQVAKSVAHYLQASDAVFVTWSEDGHPDHEAAGDALSKAAACVGAALIQYPVWAWHWADPDDARFLGTGSVRFALSATDRAAKLKAMQCFRTQTGQCHDAPKTPILPGYVLARFERDYEVYIR